MTEQKCEHEKYRLADDRDTLLCFQCDRNLGSLRALITTFSNGIFTERQRVLKEVEEIIDNKIDFLKGRIAAGIGYDFDKFKMIWESEIIQLEGLKKQIGGYCDGK